ncbi:MAG: OB-fold nucleic acid binding domain-containing protein, partial [Hydrogenovibrio sp.]|nr:OB-fold nucleic acid binding domain-containing protein [Hydrogenovibrio sp.]
MDNTDKVVHMINECYSMSLVVDPPDINLGEIHFKAVRGEKRLRYGLGAIKGVGESALEGIVAERNQNGPYRDLFDFCMRVTKKVNKRVIEALIMAGAFDCLHDNRRAMQESVGMALQKAEQKQKDEEAGQSDLFGDIATFEEENASELVAVPEMPEKQRLKGEKDVLGLYMTGHPIEAFKEELAKMVDGTLISLRPEKWVKKWVAGLIVESRSKVTKSGSRMGFVTLDDQTARLDVVLRPAVFESSKEILTPDTIILVYGEVSEDTFNGGIKLDAEQVVTLAESRVEKARAIKLYVHRNVDLPQVHELQNLILGFRAEEGLPLVIDFQNDGARAQLITEDGFTFFPDDELIEALRVHGWQPEIVL